jgi:hypothetical protein
MCRVGVRAVLAALENKPWLSSVWAASLECHTIRVGAVWLALTFSVHLTRCRPGWWAFLCMLTARSSQQRLVDVCIWCPGGGMVLSTHVQATVQCALPVWHLLLSCIRSTLTGLGVFLCCWRGCPLRCAQGL